MFLFHRSMNGSWHPAMLQRRHPELEKSFDLVENEKYAILGKQCQDLWTFWMFEDSVNIKIKLDCVVIEKLRIVG